MLPPDSLYDYFRGIIEFTELLEEFEFYDEHKLELKRCENFVDFYDLVKAHNLFNTWD